MLDTSLKAQPVDDVYGVGGNVTLPNDPLLGVIHLSSRLDGGVNPLVMHSFLNIFFIFKLPTKKSSRWFGCALPHARGMPHTISQR